MSRFHLYFILSIWVCMIVGLIGYKQWTIWKGTTVLLHTRPVDPRDLFRGDYVVLSYDISRLQDIPDKPGETIPSPVQEHVASSWQSGDPVYIVLDKTPDGKAVPLYKTRTRPIQKDSIYIAGVVTGWESWNQSIEYGIESYFVPSGKGRDLERERGNDLYARVSIDTSGHAIITGLVLRGKDVSF